MKLKFTEDAKSLWYDTANGKRGHVFVDFDDSESVRRALYDIAGSEFADAFADALRDWKYDKERDFTDFKDAIDDIVNSTDVIEDIETCSNLLTLSPNDSILDLVNQIGDNADNPTMVRNLQERLYDRVVEFEEYYSDLTGGIEELEDVLNTYNDD